ncbi:hypothetical protein EVAR_68420_1 [Eumeta japonica]|uniref:Uncharacterized protein n=1 Tax=Eumeta variegata TaxID=151549 RepID=A0A4C1ZTR7_EUMVA|nr:hypothetical protein EVAR_68420_1 [Eumeta japonica]
MCSIKQLVRLAVRSHRAPARGGVAAVDDRTRDSVQMNDMRHPAAYRMNVKSVPCLARKPVEQPGRFVY